MHARFTRRFPEQDCDYAQIGPGACPGIRKGGGAQNLKAFFFFAFQFFRGGGPARKIAEKMTFSTKKVATYR